MITNLCSISHMLFLVKCLVGCLNHSLSIVYIEKEQELWRETDLGFSFSWTTYWLCVLGP